MVATTTAAQPSSTTCGTSAQYELPVKDAACGVPNTEKYKPHIEKCALPAEVQSYDHECALFAPAIDQSVQDLTNCLYGAGVAWKDVWCFGDTNTTATSSYPSATQTSVTGEVSKATGQATSTSSSGETSSSTASPNSAVNPSRGSFGVNVVFVLMLVFSGLLNGL